MWKEENSNISQIGCTSLFTYLPIFTRRSHDSGRPSLSPSLLSLRSSLPKSKMAANLDRIQQQMQTELEKFKSVQKGNSYKKM